MDNENNNIIDFNSKKSEQEVEQFYKDVEESIMATIEFYQAIAESYQEIFNHPCEFMLDEVSDPEYILIFIKK